MDVGKGYDAGSGGGGGGGRVLGKGRRSSGAAYDGHHIALYINDFQETYKRLRAAQPIAAQQKGEQGSLGLIYNNPRFPQFRYDTLAEALGHNEFRFKDIVDPTVTPGATYNSGGRSNSSGVVYTIEHEIRSVLHPGFSCRSWVVDDD